MSDSVKRLISTNDPPDKNSLPSLIAGLDDALSLSTSIDKCIDTIQTILETMKSAKAACTLPIQQYRGAIHPIRSIPDDILRTIFHWLVTSEYGRKTSCNDPVSSKYSPWTLSRVSRGWRALVLSSPRLWSTINVIPHNSMKSKKHGLFLLSKLELVLHRSAGCDLAIRLSDKPMLCNSSLSQNLDQLLLTTGRWRSLDVVGDAFLLGILIACPFDNLVELSVRWSLSYRPPAQARYVFKNAWNLRRLTVRGEGSIDVPWERLTMFSTDIHGLSNLPKLTAVETLALDLHADQMDEKGPWRDLMAKMPRSLSFPRLRSLEITQSSEERSFCRYASQRLHVPSLTSLLIRSWNMKLPAFPGDLPRLRHISLLSTAPPAEIDAFLLRYPSITSLHLMSPHIVRLWHSHSTLLPNLAILRMAAMTLTSDPVRVIEALEFPYEKRVELRISGKEMALAKARDVISKIDGLEERWDAVCAKLGIVDADERIGMEGAF